jgi:hypothetical protein
MTTQPPSPGIFHLTNHDLATRPAFVAQILSGIQIVTWTRWQTHLEVVAISDQFQLPDQDQDHPPDHLTLPTIKLHVYKWHEEHGVPIATRTDTVVWAWSS